jgi:hypothetical protein
MCQPPIVLVPLNPLCVSLASVSVLKHQRERPPSVFSLSLISVVWRLASGVGLVVWAHFSSSSDVMMEAVSLLVVVMLVALVQRHVSRHCGRFDAALEEALQMVVVDFFSAAWTAVRRWLSHLSCHASGCFCSSESCCPLELNWFEYLEFRRSLGQFEGPVPGSTPRAAPVGAGSAWLRDRAIVPSQSS